MKKVLVAGGAGFLGSHLCERLLRLGCFVICLDNLVTGSISNIESLIDNPNFKFINHDVILPVDLQVDQIYNLASPASPPRYQADPIFTIRTNIVGSYNLLELARKQKARILQASTSEVYGDPIIHPQTEDYWGNVNPIGIRSCYDESKRCAETLFFEYSRIHSVEIKIVRIFNTYGPMMDPNDGRVVSNFVVQAISNNDITVYGDGSQTRSFCYYSDLIEGLIRMMESDIKITGPINLGNPAEFTINELAKKIILLAKSESKIIFKDLPLDDPVMRRPNIDKAHKYLKWKPTIEIDVGLINTIKYFINILSIKR